MLLFLMKEGKQRGGKDDQTSNNYSFTVVQERKNAVKEKKQTKKVTGKKR